MILYESFCPRCSNLLQYNHTYSYIFMRLDLNILFYLSPQYPQFKG